ncbi:MAG TPA: nucleotide sugar dehydrogenase, partial [Thalassospira sp.]|nr:nucleotide sugar dehydrogenase [Thalassospira sp.]
LAVSHREYVAKGWPLVEGLLKGGTGFVADVRAILPRDDVPAGIDLWRL